MSESTSSSGNDAPGDHSSDRPGGRAPTSAMPTADRVPEPSPAARRPPIALIVALAVAMGVIAALIAVLLWPENDEADDVATQPTTTLAPTTTAAPTTEPSTTTTTTATITPVDTSTAVFPSGAGGTRYADPVEAARAFAVEFVGFTNPIVGGFMQGDARSGEVAVRPASNGPVTTVLVRQLGSDGTWWVLGSATRNIVADAPAAGESISSPVTVTGTALAFEGTVNVEIRQDGARQPIGTGIVTGGGDTLRAFSGEIEFSTPSEQFGAVVFLTRSEQDGRVWEAAVVRVSFA
jgi:Immunoglobulin-like domain of bacterial spore germination